jgi:hypothetical protein
LHNSGYPGIKFEKKVDFEALYNQRFNWNNFFLNCFLDTLCVFLIHLR